MRGDQGPVNRWEGVVVVEATRSDKAFASWVCSGTVVSRLGNLWDFVIFGRAGGRFGR